MCEYCAGFYYNYTSEEEDVGKPILNEIIYAKTDGSEVPLFNLDASIIANYINNKKVPVLSTTIGLGLECINIYESNIKLKYCPMCGERLQDPKDSPKTKYELLGNLKKSVSDFVDYINATDTEEDDLK